VGCRMKSNLLIFSTGFGLLMVSGQTFAHHGTAMYDATHLTTLTGTVTGFEFSNPHVEIYFDVKDDKGKLEKWSAEAASLTMLARDGWNRSSLKPGDQITVYGHRAKNGSNAMRLQKIRMPNGQELTLP
jgi:hypothetical protein